MSKLNKEALEQRVMDRRDQARRLSEARRPFSTQGAQLWEWQADAFDVVLTMIRSGAFDVD